VKSDKLKLLIALVLLANVSCKASFPTDPTAPAPLAAVQIVLSDPHCPLPPGLDISLRALAVDTDRGYREVTREATWNSLNPSVAQIGANGRGRTLAPGVTEITASVEGVVGSGVLTVERTGPALRALSVSILGFGPRNVGDTASARAFLTGAGAANGDVTALATWTSSDPRVVTVTQGRLTAVGIGTAAIRAFYEDISGCQSVFISPRFF
jgi:hypothetical protein